MHAATVTSAAVIWSYGVGILVVQRDGGALVARGRRGFVGAVTYAVGRRGKFRFARVGNFRSALDGREVLSVVSAVRGSCRCGVRGDGRTATAGGFGGGAACDARDGLPMAPGNDIERVARELEQGLLALAHFERFGRCQQRLAYAGGFGVCVGASRMSVMPDGLGQRKEGETEDG